MKAKVKIPGNLSQQFLSPRSWLALCSRRDYVSGFRVALLRRPPFVLGFALMTPMFWRETCALCTTRSFWRTIYVQFPYTHTEESQSAWV